MTNPNNEWDLAAEGREWATHLKATGVEGYTIAEDMAGEIERSHAMERHWFKIAMCQHDWEEMADHRYCHKCGHAIARNTDEP